MAALGIATCKTVIDSPFAPSSRASNICTSPPLPPPPRSVFSTQPDASSPKNESMTPASLFGLEYSLVMSPSNSYTTLALELSPSPTQSSTSTILAQGLSSIPFTRVLFEIDSRLNTANTKQIPQTFVVIYCQLPPRQIRGASVNVSFS